MLRLDLDPTRAASVQSFTLDGVEILFRVAWRPSAQSWFASAETAEGVSLFTGRRLAAKSVVDSDRTLPGHPGGAFVVIGPDPYVQGDLGRSLVVLYGTDAEIESITTRDPLSGYTVTP